MELWKRFCDYQLTLTKLGISLDISRVRFDDGYFSKLEVAFAEAFKAMKALETGAIANPDENRMVGHYWLRTPELAPDATLQKAIKDSFATLKSFAANVRSGKITGSDGKNSKMCFCSESEARRSVRSSSMTR
jgi:glucose-6-phosphate isomerase